MNELQKDDVVLPGGIGFLRNSDGTPISEITKIEPFGDGGCTLTLSPLKKEEPRTEDAEFEVLPPKQLENE